MESSWIFNMVKNNKAGELEFTINEEEEEMKCLSSDKISSYSENYVLIQKNYKEKVRLRKEIERLKEREDKTLALLANEVFDFCKCLNGLKDKMAEKGLEEELRGLEILQKKMHDILEENDLEIMNLTGKTLNNELLNQVKVLKYIKEEGVQGPVVTETKIPLIYRNGKLVQMGVVIAASPLDKDGG